MRRLIVVLIALVMITASCSQKGETVIPDSPGDPVVRKVIEFVRKGQIEDALLLFESGELPPDSVELLGQTGPILSATTSIKLINYRLFKPFKTDRLDETLVFHVTGPEKAALVFASTRTAASATKMRTFRVHPAPLDLSEIYPFTLAGKHIFQYAVLLASILVPAFIVLTVVSIIRSPRRKKWIWIPFALIGIGKLGVQWVEGGRNILQPLAFQILGASIFKYPLYEPWVLAVSLPLGAILFWVTNSQKPPLSDLRSEAQDDA